MAKSSPEKMLKTMINNLPEKTGKSLDQWMAVLKKSSLAKHGEMVKWLKSEHGITHGFANLIAQRHLNSGSDDKDLVTPQYAGAKETLRPIYDAICKVAGNFGGDVDISPRKTYVSLRRSKQFALVQASTKDRVDVGIVLHAVEETERLEKSGSFNAMVTHRVRITDKKQIDKELKQWLRAAYDAA